MCVPKSRTAVIDRVLFIPKERMKERVIITTITSAPRGRRKQARHPAKRKKKREITVCLRKNVLKDKAEERERERERECHNRPRPSNTFAEHKQRAIPARKRPPWSQKLNLCSQL